MKAKCRCVGCRVPPEGCAKYREHIRLQAEHAKVEELLAVVQNGCNQLDDVELPAVALRFLFAVEEKAQAVKEARGE